MGVLGLYLAGRKNRVGWVVGIGAQVLWLAYALSTEQWGFLVSVGAYGWVYTKNWLRWRAEARAELLTSVEGSDGGGTEETECRAGHGQAAPGRG